MRVLLTGLLVLVALGSVHTARQSAKKPNVMFILAGAPTDAPPPAAGPVCGVKGLAQTTCRVDKPSLVSSSHELITPHLDQLGRMSSA